MQIVDLAGARLLFVWLFVVVVLAVAVYVDGVRVVVVVLTLGVCAAGVRVESCVTFLAVSAAADFQVPPRASMLHSHKGLLV